MIQAGGEAEQTCYTELSDARVMYHMCARVIFHKSLEILASIQSLFCAMFVQCATFASGHGWSYHV